MRTILPLQERGAAGLTAAGGKGANLARMAAAGFPVPQGFVLTTAAYRAFVQGNERLRHILEPVAGAGPGAPPADADAAAAIKKLFLAGEFPEKIREDLVSAYAELGGEAETAVAVRSSATAEDLPQASFAGQQETFLNVRGAEALLQAVRTCWAGLWTARALAYRERMGMDHETAAMAVIVQEMVPAAVSGVLFTANPTTGARDELVVNASFGLGEAIVSGLVTPDTYVLDREQMAVKERVLGTKEVMVVADEQRTTTRPVPAARRSESALAPGPLTELAALSVQVEAHFEGVPQDIEWAVVEGKCWLLQARPITNLPPPPLRNVRWEPPRPGTLWMRRQVVEHMPEPLSPLFDELYLQEGLDQSMQDMAGFMSDLAGFEIDIWEIVDPPFAVTVNGYAYSMASFNFSWRLIPLIVRLYAGVLPKMLRHMLPHWRNQSLPAYRAIIERWKSVDLDAAPDAELLRGVRELAMADAGYWFAAAVPLGLARITDAVLDGFVKRVVSDRGRAAGLRPTSGSYLRGFPSKTVAAQIQLEAIAAAIRDSETVLELVTKMPAARLLAALAEHPAARPVLDELQRYFETYGHQIYNLDFAAPTLADDPLPVLLSLKTAVAHPERDARAHQARLAQERDRLVARTEQSLNPLTRRIFRQLLHWAQRFSPYREEALFYVGAAWPALRRLALELGRRLTVAGSLQVPDDVFYLRSAELAAAAAARAAGNGRAELAELARERRLLREARRRLDPPVSVPPDGRMKFGPIDMAFFEPKPRVDSTGPTLSGFAVSPGQVTAAASVIRSPAEFEKMVADTILVCTTTTPAWTPLFSQAQGLVTDIGGALAHGSIVAREYGIPAVMGTGAATQRITSGQRIRVDGDGGTVTLLDEVEAGGSRTAEQPRPEKRRASKKKLLVLAAAAAVLVIWWQKRRRSG